VHHPHILMESRNGTVPPIDPAAAKITARIGGRTVTARQAPWSADAAVKFFWFDPQEGMVSDLKAYDSKGRALPVGNNGVGSG
jgi:hypothetical protein